MIAVVPRARMGLGLSNDEVVEQHIEHVKVVVASLGQKRLAAIGGQDDAMQIGVMALLRAASSFDPQRTIPFGRYAQVCVANAFAEPLRRSSLWDFDRIPDEFDEAIDDSPWIDDMDIAVIGELIERLPNRQRTIVKRHHGIECEPTTFADMAHETGVTRQAIHHAYMKAIRRLRKMLKVQAD